MSTLSSPLATLDKAIESGEPFAIIRKEQSSEASLFRGTVTSCKKLTDIPHKTGKFGYESLSIIPFGQAAENGMEVVPDTAKIRCMQITDQTKISDVELIQALPEETIGFDREPVFEQSDEDYADKVRRVIRDQIGKGNACNVVISANISGTIAAMSPKKALTIFGNLLKQEFGAYMTFFFFDGEQYHIGASPERHISVDRGIVTMNPISGTYRKTNFLIDRKAFKEFLQDPKEINELFMCVDEEMKQMAEMCGEGGQIEGPLLKEMSGLVHTEYLLVGRSERDCIDLLRTSMHAPTVTGSPQESAFSIIKNMENEPRGYYGGELVLMGHHEDGSEFLDSAITIRTMQILPNGLVMMRVGASIVRDSDPISEAKEIRAKGSGAMRALTGNKNSSPEPVLPQIMDDDLRSLLKERNLTMNRFLFEDQEGKDHTVPELMGKTVTIIDFKDRFSYVLMHMIRALGAQANVVEHEHYSKEKDTADIVIVGPGPGDPTDENSPAMKILGEVTRDVLKQKRPFLSVCLGHQKLCEVLGMEVKAKAEPSQGMQRTIDFFGKTERLGFYNTFAATFDGKRSDLSVSSDSLTGEVFAVRGSHFSGFQFHAESIMSQNGFTILADELKRILG